ncbi:MAG TPA: hypothetical protein VH744_08655 [Terriglobales bacterium]
MKRLVKTLALTITCAVLVGFAETASVEIVIPRACMEGVALSADTECRGADRGHLLCTGMVLTVKSGCEVVRVR